MDSIDDYINNINMFVFVESDTGACTGSYQLDVCLPSAMLAFHAIVQSYLSQL